MVSRTFKASRVKFCPMYGSDVVTHLGSSDFVCGTNDTEREAQAKVNGEGKRCNRAFKVIHPVQQLESNGQHRREIGARVDQIRRQSAKS
jgi:hypothetical protein